MKALDIVLGESPFTQLVDHARKIHACISLLRPIADAVIRCDTRRLEVLQHTMSATEYEADQIKDQIRQHLPRRFFLSVNREDILNYVRQLDRMADDAEDFAVVATFRPIQMPQELQTQFLALVDKVQEVSNVLLELAELLAALEKEAFEGPRAEMVLNKIEAVCHMEWESDKISRQFARLCYASTEIDAISIILMEKLCQALTGIADHAENVGKNLRLMILRR